MSSRRSPKERRPKARCSAATAVIRLAKSMRLASRRRWLRFLSLPPRDPNRHRGVHSPSAPTLTLLLLESRLLRAERNSLLRLCRGHRNRNRMKITPSLVATPLLAANASSRGSLHILINCPNWYRFQISIFNWYYQNCQFLSNKQTRSIR